MTTTVFFIRHGTHDRLAGTLCGRMDGVGLSEAGRAQAQALARRLASEPVIAVYSSPLERARETAAPIAAALDLPVEIAEEINEIEYGAWTGSAFADLAGDPAWSAWNAERSAHRPPGGESMGEVQARVASWLDGAVRRHPHETVAAVCHGDVIKAGLALALGLSLDHLQRFEVGPGSISVVVAGDWGRRVHSINEAPR